MAKKKEKNKKIVDAKVSKGKSWVDYTLLTGAGIALLVFLVWGANKVSPKPPQFVDQDCCDQFCYAISAGKSLCYDFVGEDIAIFRDTEKNVVYCQESAEDIPFIYIPKFIIKDVPKVCNSSEYVNLTTGEKLNEGVEWNFS